MGLMPDPGLHHGIPQPEYLSWEAASASRLRVLRNKTPAHMREEIARPTEATADMKLGAAIHCAVLQPDLFTSLFVEDLPIAGQGKGAYARRDAHREEHKDKTFLRPGELELSEAIAKAVRAHPKATALFGGEAEVSALWRDAETSLPCKGRFDEINRDLGVIVDLKTTKDASDEGFPREIYRYRYYMQGAHYLEGAKANGIDANHFAIVAVEKEPFTKGGGGPWCVALYRIMDEALVAGRDELRQLLDVYAECQKTGKWPGYKEDVVDINLSPWDWRNLERKVYGA